MSNLTTKRPLKIKVLNTFDKKQIACTLTTAQLVHCLRTVIEREGVLREDAIGLLARSLP